MPLDVKETANAMFRSLDQPHINPTTVLNLLSVMFMSYPQCKEIITGMYKFEYVFNIRCDSPHRYKRGSYSKRSNCARVAPVFMGRV